MEIKLTEELMRWYEGKSIEIDNVRYVFSVNEGPLANGVRIDSNLVVDVYEDNEWEHELCNSYMVDDVITGEPWLPQLLNNNNR